MMRAEMMRKVRRNRGIMVWLSWLSFPIRACVDAVMDVGGSCSLCRGR